MGLLTKKAMHEKIVSLSGYLKSTYDDISGENYETLKRLVEGMRGRLIDKSCEKGAFIGFPESHERPKENVHTTTFKVLEQSTVKTFIPGGADELLDNNMHNVSDSEQFAQNLRRSYNQAAHHQSVRNTLCE